MVKKCISCDSKNNLTIIKKDSFLGYPAYGCKKCGLIFLYSDDSSIDKRCIDYYKKEYWDTVRKKWDDSRKLINVIIKFLRFIGTSPLQQLWHYRLMQKYGKQGKKSLLDIGCAKGDFMFFFKSKGYEVNGIEPDKKNVSIVNNKFKKTICVQGSAEKVNIKGKFDVIYMCHVFEHLIRPDNFLKKIRKNLNKKGIVLFEVPNCENPIILKNSLDHHPHIFNFTKISFGKLFEKSGYDVVKVGAYSEKYKGNITMFFMMLFGLDNYKELPNKRADRLVIVAKAR
ncbi:class I SAM-dependent methyltransferase [Candidatus Woesearchaeota archaeon]|nr:class I SAM-dependent methyltransferase [Candidatus Woesearchaeota archaeon]